MASMSVFSLQFNNNNDSFEIIPEIDTDSKSQDSGFQSAFQKVVASDMKKTGEIEPLAFSCNYCGKRYQLHKMLQKHEQICQAGKEKLHICPSCNRNYKSTKAFKKHVFICMQVNRAPCLVDWSLCFCCEELTDNAHTGHLRCPNCPKSFRTQNGFKRHLMLLHAATTKFKCELCNAQCSNAYILKLHRQSHNDEIDQIERNFPEYKCNKCDKNFLDKIAFDIHLSNHRGDDIKPNISYQCVRCHMNLPSPEAHKDHTCEDLNKAKYKCNLCGKTLSSEGFYQRHISTHMKYNELPDRDSKISIVNSETDLNANNKRKDFDELMMDFVKIPVKKKIKQETIKGTEIQSNSSESVRILNGLRLCTDPYSFEFNQSRGTFSSAPRSYKKATKVNNNEVNTNTSDNEEFSVETILKNINKKTINTIDLNPMNETTLRESVTCFLKILLDVEMLKIFGWPQASVEMIIVDILYHLECKPSMERNDITKQLRENVKLLIEAVVDNASTLCSFDSLDVIDLILIEIIKYGRHTVLSK